jgi:hypothetical protein
MILGRGCVWCPSSLGASRPAENGYDLCAPAVYSGFQDRGGNSDQLARQPSTPRAFLVCHAAARLALDEQDRSMEGGEPLVHLCSRHRLDRYVVSSTGFADKAFALCFREGMYHPGRQSLLRAHHMPGFKGWQATLHFRGRSHGRTYSDRWYRPGEGVGISCDP